MTPPRFLAIIGPTASGKTALSLRVAEALDGEIISMDSRQVYRGMDVGTAKAGPEERARVRHHGLDILDPDERYSAGRFAEDAREWIDEIEGRGRVPMLVGGTGFFLKALLDPIFEEPPLDSDRLERLREHLARYPVERLEKWVRTLDPERAEVATAGGRQRLTRTLEVALLTGHPLSVWHEAAAAERRDDLQGLVVCLRLPRERLDERIRERTAGMIAEGLVDEVRTLADAGYDEGDPGMTGTGYREILEHLQGNMQLEEAEERIVIRTRQYARRQLTWFRNQLPESTTYVDASAPVADQARVVVERWREAAMGARTEFGGEGEGPLEGEGAREVECGREVE